MKYRFTITFVILTAMFVNATLAQVAPTPQAALERGKTDSLTKDNYRQTLQSLHITLPVLPPQADDSTRPPNSLPRTNGSGYTDTQGRSLTRSPWGAWVNYKEDGIAFSQTTRGQSQV